MNSVSTMAWSGLAGRRGDIKGGRTAAERRRLDSKHSNARRRPFPVIPAPRMDDRILPKIAALIPR